MVTKTFNLSSYTLVAQETVCHFRNQWEMVFISEIT